MGDDMRTPTIIGHPGASAKELTFEEISKTLRNKGYHSATFEEVLQYTSAKIKLDVELKKEVVELLSKYFKKGHFVWNHHR